MNKIRYLSLLMLLLSGIVLWGNSAAPSSPDMRTQDGETLLTVVADPPEGGTVSGGGSYAAGTQVNLRATANTNFQFVNWTLNGEEISTERNFTYTKKDADETLIAHFVYNPNDPNEPTEPVKLTRLDVVADPVDGGSVSGGGNYETGAQVSLKASPNTGFVFVNWTRNDQEVSTERNFTYTKEDGDETLTAHFAYQPGNPNEPDEPDIKPVQKKYKLTVVSEEGGTNVSGSGEYVSGTQVTLSVSISTGFSFQGWYNEADSLLSTSTRFSYTTQEKDETITARIKYTPNNPSEPEEPNLPSKPNPHKITVVAVPSDGGSVSVGSETVVEGEQTRVRATANTGFEFRGWYVADMLFQTAADFYYTMGNKDISMEARFVYNPSSPSEPEETSKKSYTLYLTSVRGLPGRTVQYPVYLSSQDSLTNIQFNLTFPVGLTPDIENIKLSGKAQGYTLSCKEVEVMTEETQGAPRRAADRETAYQFTLTDGKLPACNTRLMVIDVAISENVTDTTQQVKVNQVTVTDTGGTNTTASTRNGTVTMNESSGDGTYYYLTLISTGSGQATVNSRTVRNSLHIFDLLEGSSTNVYFTPDNGYHIDKVTLDEVDITDLVLENSRYLFSNVNADATLTVMFAEGADSGYDLKVSATGSGVVRYNGESIRNSERIFSVNHGGHVEMDIIPDKDARISQVLLNDTSDVTSLVAEGKYVIESMTSENKLSVTFEDLSKVDNVKFEQSGRLIAMSTATENALIHYTLSNNEAGEQTYTTPLMLTGDCTISAYAMKEGYINSDTTQFVFIANSVTVAAPVIVSNGAKVGISTTTEEAVIYYTIDGTEPTAESTVYTDSITVERNCTIKAIAMRQNWFPSQVTSYVVDLFKVSSVTFAQNGYIISLSTPTSDAIIRYTLSNGEPGEQTYSTPLTLTGNSTIDAYAVREGYNNSDTTQFLFTAADVTVAAPVIASNGAKVGISTTTPEAVIHYTIDGTEPTEQSTVYTDSITVERNCTIKAIAMRKNWFSSEVTTFEFVAPIDATFDSNGVLAVGGSTTMTDALESVGGRDKVAKTITAIVWNSSAALANSDLTDISNPNMLIYVPSESQAPQNRDNVVIGNDSTGYTAKNVVLTDVVEGNGNFYCPKEFTAEMISYTHEYRQTTEVGVSRGWETIAMPFNVQTVMHEKQGLIAPFGNSTSKKHFWLRHISTAGQTHSLAQATTIKANMPYLISMPNSDAYPEEYNLAGRVTFSSQNVPVIVTDIFPVHMSSGNGGMLMFVPCFQTQQVHEMVYALNVGEARDGYPEGSVFVANYREIHPFEAYTVHEGNSPAPQFMPIIDFNGSMTGIDASLVNSEEVNSEKWYDLNGRKLQKKPTQKGVYLLNGRKVVMR